MALTRRTEQFGVLARAVEEELRDRNIELEAAVVDQIVRNRVDAVAELMDVSTRTALGYAPADLPRIIADAVLEASLNLQGESPLGQPRPRLRIVD